MNKVSISFFLLTYTILFCCNQPFIPKQKSYPKINFPKKEYSWTTAKIHNISIVFKMPQYAHLSTEKNNDNPKDPWYNITFPSLGAKVYLTYKPIQNNLDILIKDCYSITFKQQIKATIIKDSSFQTPQGNKGIWFYVGGDAATKYQFLIFKPEKHFLRGSLYFNTSPNEDSLAIVQDFLKTDLDTFIHTLQFQ